MVEIKKISLEIKDGGLVFKLDTENGIVYLKQPLEKIETFLEECKTTIIDFKNKTSIFKINEYITLKLENDRTNIYIKGGLFNQCKYLFLDIPADKIEDYEDILSIDDASEKLDNRLERIRTRKRYNITPQQEFQGHCSNLQVWAENNYDTRLLHRNLAFPLLRKLSEGGDPIAKRNFKDEIIRRIESGEENVYIYLKNKHYLDNFTLEELTVIAENNKNRNIQIELFRDIISKEENSKITEKTKEIIKKLNDPFLELFVLNRDENNEFSLWKYDPNIKGFFDPSRNILICAYDVEIAFKNYQEDKNFFEENPCRLVGKVYLDFGIRYRNKKVCFQRKYVKFARKVLNNNKDITIALPNGEGPIKLSSKKANLRVYIGPIFFDLTS